MRWAVLLLALAACGHVAPAAPSAPAGPAARAERAPPDAVAEPAPIAIETDGGIRVDIDELEVQVDVHGPLARTTIHATFRNAEDRTVEGRFRVALPPRSSLARVAMKVGAEWREAEVAELGAARTTYERSLHRRRDPLLVEQRRAREITARVAPLAAYEHKEIIVAFTSEVGAEAPVVVPLRGLPEVRKLDVRVDGIAEPVRQHWARTVPEADLRVPVFASAVRAGELVAVRVTPSIVAEPEPIEGPLVILVETTASHAADLATYARLVQAIGGEASVIAYDQTAELLPRGEIAARLTARGALGAAALDVGLAAAEREAKRIGAKRLVLLGGNPPVLDDGRTRALAGIDRVDVLGVGPRTDARSYHALLERPHRGAWIDDAGALDEAGILRRLHHRVVSVPARIEGATWSSVTSFEHVSPGEERLVLARVAPKAKLEINGEVHAPSEDVAAASALELAVATAKLDALIERGAKKEAVTLARKHRLLSPWTSLIVLESDDDLAQLRQDEKAGIPPPGPRPVKPAKPVVVREATVAVNGRIPPEIIQRQVWLKIGLFRACVDDAAKRSPSVAGRVIVLFVIGRDGKVRHARDNGSEVKDPKLVACMVQAFLTLEFPPPDGSMITVVYPFSVGDPERPHPMPLASRPAMVRSPWAERTGADPAETVVKGPWCTLFADLRAQPDAPLGHSPTTVVALGEALATRGDHERATRAFGSLADLWPERAELLRVAATRIDQLRPGDPTAIALLRHAVAERPDQPSGHHLLGLMLLRARDVAGARAAFQTGLARGYEPRYDGVERLLRRDLALLEPTAAASRDLVMTWETDTSDVDLVVVDAKRESSGGVAYARASDGYGPEALEPAPAGRQLGVKLVRRGLGGDVFGVVHVIKRSERGDVTVEPRPFAIMTEGAVLELGPI